MPAQKINKSKEERKKANFALPLPPLPDNQNIPCLPYIHTLPLFLFSSGSSSPIQFRRRSIAARRLRSTSARDAIELQLQLAGSLELGSLTAHGSGPQAHLCFSFPFPSLSSLGLIPDGGDWASGGAIRHIFAQPFTGDEHPPGMPGLLFPSAVRDGAPQTVTKLFVFRSDPVTIYYL